MLKYDTGRCEVIIGLGLGRDNLSLNKKALQNSFYRAFSILGMLN